MLKNFIYYLKLPLKAIKVIKHLLSGELLFRFEFLRIMGKLLVPEYRFKWPQIEWWQNEFFNQYLEKFNEIDGMNTDRHWMLYQLLRLVENIPGDTAECGVYQGASSYLICKMNSKNQIHSRIHYIFDSFEGLSEPSKLDGSHWKKGDLSCGIDVLKSNLSDCENFSLHPGWIPDRFVDIENKKFAFVHIDVDLYQPTLDSLKFFYSRMTKGGIIICDDYGFTTCVGATQAINEFLLDKPEKMISISCGGGFMVKDNVTSKDLN